MGDETRKPHELADLLDGCSYERSDNLIQRSAAELRRLADLVDSGTVAPPGAAEEPNPLLDWSMDEEECNACAAIEDFCPFHRGVGQGEAVMIELIRFCADEAEGMWHAMRKIKRSQEATRARSDTAAAALAPSPQSPAELPERSMVCLNCGTSPSLPPEPREVTYVGADETRWIVRSAPPQAVEESEV